MEPSSKPASDSAITDSARSDVPLPSPETPTSEVTDESVRDDQSTVSTVSDLSTMIGVQRRGRCKWFNVAKGWGFITPSDNGPDVFVHQSVIQMGGFRSLGDEEEVEFICKASEKGFEATFVTGPQHEDCKGSHRRPNSKKKFRKVRCYNCGEFANHIASKCQEGPMPKRCHQCKATDHLIADCPKRSEKVKSQTRVEKEEQHHHSDSGLENQDSEEEGTEEPTTEKTIE